MTDEQTPQAIPVDEMPAEVPIPVDAIQVRSIDKRELDIRMLPWNTVIDTTSGLEEFRSGAFADASPDDVLLMGMEHEAQLGLGQNGQPMVVRHPVGKAIALDDRPDAMYGTFRVAKTARGDEVLALAAEGLVKGASVEWMPMPHGSSVEDHRGRRKTVHSRARLTGVSTTYRPAYQTAGVIAVRSDHKEDAPVADDKAAPAATPEEPPAEPVQVTNVVDLCGVPQPVQRGHDRRHGPDHRPPGQRRGAGAQSFQLPTEGPAAAGGDASASGPRRCSRS